MTFAAIGDHMVSAFLPSQAAEQSLTAASQVQAARALKYAAGRRNYLGGTGLVYAKKSKPFMRMMAKSEALGELAEGVPAIDMGLAAGNSIGPVSMQARSGACAAAFPVF
jgi:hypothetical protein